MVMYPMSLVPGLSVVSVSLVNVNLQVSQYESTVSQCKCGVCQCDFVVSQCEFVVCKSKSFVRQCMWKLGPVVCFNKTYSRPKRAHVAHINLPHPLSLDAMTPNLLLLPGVVL